MAETISPEMGTPAPCDLVAIGSLARHGAYEIDVRSDEVCFDANSPVVEKNIIVRLVNCTTGRCPKCGGKMRKTPYLSDAVVCVDCERIYSTREDDKARWVIPERGLANFVAKSLGAKEVFHCADVFHMGEVGGRDLFFAINPTQDFFMAHGPSTSLVALGSIAAKPKDWPGKIAMFTELYYPKHNNGTIGVAQNIKRIILPVDQAKDGLKTVRIIHERRDQWLSFLMWMLSEPYNPAHFYRDKLKFATVRDWFVENVKGAPKNPITYKRDHNEFMHLIEVKKGKKIVSIRDSREAQILTIIKRASDPTLPQRQRLEIARALSEVALKLKRGRDQNEGRPVEMPVCIWQYTGDGKGTRELVAVTEDKTDEINLWIPLPN